jgi:glyoxylase-like metal-dependent hydrolase (beta-lactamase superfamily II)
VIPFNRTFTPEYGQPQRLSARVQRIVARNPGRFTWTGTGTILVGGEKDVAIIDPGPDCEDHMAAIAAAIGRRTVTHVLVTHNHLDHSGCARELADRFDAPLCGRRGISVPNDAGAARVEAEDDENFSPDIQVAEGWQANGKDWSVTAVHTPGHTAEHFCYSLEEERTLFCGDHVMAWSTSVVTPPDGNMGDYIASLTRVRDMDFARLVPTHGPHIDDPSHFIDAYIGHRLRRREEVLAQLQRGVQTIRAMVDRLYHDLEPALRPAAALSIWAHLIQLVEEGVAVAEAPGGLSAHYQLRAAPAA